MKSLYALCIIRTYSAREKKRYVAVVVIEHSPRKLFARTSVALTTGVKQQHICVSLILSPSFYVVGFTYAQRLDNLHVRQYVGHQCSLQVVYIYGALVAMQLQVVELVVVSMGYYRLRHFVDKHTNLLRQSGASLRAVLHLRVSHVRYYASMGVDALHIARTLGIEDEAHHIYAQLVNRENVIWLSHAANLNLQCSIFNSQFLEQKFEVPLQG